MMKNRIISMLLLLCMMLTGLPLVQAEENVRMPDAYEEIPLPSELPFGPPEEEKRYLSPSDDWQTEAGILSAIEQVVIEAILAGKDSVDISQYKVYPSQLNLMSLLYFSPYLSGGIGIQCWYYKDSYYSKIDITCPLTESEVITRFALIEERITELSGFVSACPTNMEKILFLHDYFIYTGEYDYDNYLAGTIPEDSYRSAGILMNRVGVCQSYAFAMKYFLHLEGIECHVVSSDSMNHAWNVVKLGNSYYHIDVTWDDPTLDRLGRVRHNNFLVSDSAISVPRGDSKKNHHGWDRTDLVCESTVYDNAFWTYADSFIYRSGDYFYFIRENGIVKRTVQDGSEKYIKEFDKWLSADGKGYWIGSYSGLWLNGTKLYYNSGKEICRIDINTLNDESVYTPSLNGEGIYGSSVFDGVLYYQHQADPNTAGGIRLVSLDSITGTETIVLSHGNIVLNEGDSFGLVASVKNGGNNAKVYWSSDNTLVATVDGNGNVTAKGAGSTYINAETAGGAKERCYVTVMPNGTAVEPPKPVIPDEPSPSDVFTDVKKTSWFKNAVDFVVGKGLMNGTSATKFEPNSPMNRAMLVTVLWRMEGSPAPEGTVPFTDLKQAWYRDAVAWAYSREIVNGTTETTFSPNKNITREQMAAILFRYSSYKGYDTSGYADVMKYPDGLSISSYAILSMAWANGAGLITGKPSGDSLILAPRGKATRAEVATILQRYFDIYK